MATATETKRLSDLKDFWKSSEIEHNNFIERFKENFRFVVGGDQQWDPEDIATLDEDGRPHLTYNEILPKVNVIAAEFLENMMDVKVFARRGGTVTGANILTAISKHATDLCNSEFEEAECFCNGIMGGLGVLHWYRDYSEDPFNGDLVIENRWPADIVFDLSTRKYDINKSQKFVFDEWWWDKEKLKLAYPKRAADIEGGGLDTPPEDSFYGKRSFATERYEEGYQQSFDESVYSPDDLSSRKFKYRTRNCWWKSYGKQLYLWDRARSVEIIKIKKNTETFEKSKLLVYRNPERFRIIERTSATLHKTVQAGQLILEDIEDPLGPKITRFPFVRFCPYFLGGYIMGVVDNAKDPQREFNKRMSQTLHILNVYAKGLWLNKKSGGADPVELEDAANRAGAIVSYEDTKPEQTKPTTLDSGHFTLAASNSQAIGRIMGVRENMEGGLESKEQSGVAIYRRQLQGLKMIRPLLNRWRQTKQYENDGIVEYLRYSDIYSEEEIRNIVGDEELLDKKIVLEIMKMIGPAPQPPPQPNPEAMAALQRLDQKRGGMASVAVSIEYQKAADRYKTQNEQYQTVLKEKSMEKLFEQIRSIEFGRYGIKVSMSPDMPTLRLALFQQMLDARKQGLMIPDDMIIEQSEWPNKEKIIERMRQIAAQPVPA